jgi:hypothetical protein
MDREIVEMVTAGAKPWVHTPKSPNCRRKSDTSSVTVVVFLEPGLIDVIRSARSRSAGYIKRLDVAAERTIGSSVVGTAIKTDTPGNQKDTILGLCARLAFTNAAGSVVHPTPALKEAGLVYVCAVVI